MAKKKDMKKLRFSLGVKRLFLLLFSLFIIGLSTGMFLLYGPITWLRETLITTAMTTMTHQKYARWFYDEATINRVLANNKIIESGDETDPNLIHGNQSGKWKNKFERQLFEGVTKNMDYRIIDISGPRYKGYLVAVYKPEKVQLATTSRLGVIGQSTKVISRNNNAQVAINAGGFYDPDWNSNGAIPHGITVSKGKIVYEYAKAGVGGGMVGFNKDNVLVLGRMTRQQVIDRGIRDGVEFGPFLVVNGKPSFVKGDGGWGIAPRTAIGQRRDGVVLMLVIDGRTTRSLGAGMVELTEIMMNYGAWNAANMDGGSSSSLIVNNKVHSRPVAGGAEGLRNLPTAWIVAQ